MSGAKRSEGAKMTQGMELRIVGCQLRVGQKAASDKGGQSLPCCEWVEVASCWLSGVH